VGGLQQLGTPLFHVITTIETKQRRVSKSKNFSCS